MKMMTFNLTDRAAAIAEGWRKNRVASKMISRLVEDRADRFAENDMARPGDRRKLHGTWAEKGEDGIWKAVE